MPLDIQLINDLLEYYAKPYPQPIAGTIARPFHGKLHACMAAHALELMVALYRKYLPSDLADYNNDKEMQELVLLGALCHDIGNKSENHKNEQDHADIFIRELKAKTQYSQSKIQQIASAIMEKDANRQKNIYCRLIGDVDRLEFNRILINSSDFKIEYLEFYKQCKLHGVANAENELRHIVAHYFHLVHFLNDCKEIHEALEQSKDCFNDVKYYITAYRIWTLLGLEYTKDKLIFPELPLFLSQSKTKIPVLELYNDVVVDKAGKIALNLYQEIMTANRCKPAKRISVDDLYNGQDRVLIRRLIKSMNKPNPVTEELLTLSNNHETLTAKAQEFEEKAKPGATSKILIDGFKYRPADCKVRGIYHADFSRNSSGFTLNVKTTKIYYIYKENAVTNNILDAKYDTEKPNGIKKMASIDDLVNKTVEMEKRRHGELPDPTCRYVGRYSLNNNELLTNYNLGDITSILVQPNKWAARSALCSRIVLALTHRRIPFYMHHTFRDFESVTEDTVLAWAGLKSNNGCLEIPIFEDIPPQFNALIQAPEYPKIASWNSLTLTNYDDDMSKWRFTFNGSLQHQPHIQIPMLSYIKDKMPVVEIGKVIQADYRGLFRTAVTNEVKSIVKEINDFFKSNDILLMGVFGANHFRISEQVKNNAYFRYYLHFRAITNVHCDFHMILGKLGLTEHSKLSDLHKETLGNINEFINVKFRIRSLPAIFKLRQELRKVDSTKENFYSVSNANWLTPIMLSTNSEIQKIFFGGIFNRMMSFLTTSKNIHGLPDQMTIYLNNPNCILNPLQKFLLFVQLSSEGSGNYGVMDNLKPVYYALMVVLFESNMTVAAKNIMQSFTVDLEKYRSLNLLTPDTPGDLINQLIINGAIGLNNHFSHQNFNFNDQNNIRSLLKLTRNTSNKIYLFNKFTSLLSLDIILFDIAFLDNHYMQLKTDTIMSILSLMIPLHDDDPIYSHTINKICGHNNITAFSTIPLLDHAIRHRAFDIVKRLTKRIPYYDPDRDNLMLFIKKIVFLSLPQDVKHHIINYIMRDDMPGYNKPSQDEFDILFNKLLANNLLKSAENLLEFSHPSSVNFIVNFASWSRESKTLDFDLLKRVLQYKLTTTKMSGEKSKLLPSLTFIQDNSPLRTQTNKEIFYLTAHVLSYYLRYESIYLSEIISVAQILSSGISSYAPSNQDLIDFPSAIYALELGKYSLLVNPDCFYDAVARAYTFAKQQKEFEIKHNIERKTEDEFMLYYMGIMSCSIVSKESEEAFYQLAKNFDDKTKIILSFCQALLKNYYGFIQNYNTKKLHLLMIAFIGYIKAVERNNTKEDIHNVYHLLHALIEHDIQWNDLISDMVRPFIALLYFSESRSIDHISLCLEVAMKHNLDLSLMERSRLYYLAARNYDDLKKWSTCFQKFLENSPTPGITHVERAIMVNKVYGIPISNERHALYNDLDAGKLTSKSYQECAELEMKENLPQEAAFHFMAAYNYATTDDKTRLNKQIWPLMAAFNLTHRISLIELILDNADKNHPELKQLNVYINTYLNKKNDYQLEHLLRVIFIRVRIAQPEMADILHTVLETIFKSDIQKPIGHPNDLLFANFSSKCTTAQLNYSRISLLIDELYPFLDFIPEFHSVILSLIKFYESYVKDNVDTIHLLRLRKFSTLFSKARNTHFSTEERSSALNEAVKEFNEIDPKSVESEIKKYELLKLSFKYYLTANHNESKNESPDKLAIRF